MNDPLSSDNGGVTIQLAKQTLNDIKVIREQLSSIRVPTFIAVGTKDHTINNKWTMKNAAEMIHLRRW